MTLFQAITKLARQTHAFSDADLGQPWAWRKHDEGVRFALLGSTHDLRDLAVRLGDTRAHDGPPRTRAQRALAQYHAAYRDLQAILLGMPEDAYDDAPGAADWPLRTVLGHIVDTEMTFFALVHYGRRRHHSDEALPVQFPNEERERLFGPRGDFWETWEEASLPEALETYGALHRRTLDTFSDIDDEEIEALSLWWEGEEYSLQYRLHRFEAHLRQHSVQAEKVLAATGRAPNEAKRLLRHVYNALAEVEGLLIGAPELGRAERAALAKTLTGRAETVAEVVAQARKLMEAVPAGDVATVTAILSAHPDLARAVNQDGLSALLVAAYHNQPEGVAALRAAGKELNVFEAAALGDLEAVQAAYTEWPGWIHEFGRDGFNPLHLACYFGHEAVARWLVEQGAGVTVPARNEQLIRPIHAASAHGHVEIVELLLPAGADVNARQKGGFTPLHAAAFGGYPDLARLLLDHGADPALENDDGKTALALAEDKGHDEVAELLREAEGGD